MIPTSENYLKLLQSLLPRGPLWNRDDGSRLTEFLHGLAEEITRLSLRSNDLLKESDVRYSSELLIDHENDLGLPDECSPENLTITERRNAAHSKLIAVGEQNPAYFIELAASFGWDITITEYTPFWSGVGVCGDPCGDQDVIFCWKITIDYSGENIVYFTSGSSVSGDSLGYIPGTDQMLCVMNKYKPAHTIISFDYDGFAFDKSFDSSFDSLISDFEGAFLKAFSSGFDVHYGGSFSHDNFNNEFMKPN